MKDIASEQRDACDGGIVEESKQIKSMPTKTETERKISVHDEAVDLNKKIRSETLPNGHKRKACHCGKSMKKKKRKGTLIETEATIAYRWMKRTGKPYSRFMKIKGRDKEFKATKGALNHEEFREKNSMAGKTPCVSSLEQTEADENINRPEIPQLASLLFEKDVNDEDSRMLHKLVCAFLKKLLSEYENLIYNMCPLNNGPRSNHRTPQAMRILFGEDVVDDPRNTPETVLRYIYGPKAVLKTTGMSPKDFKVRGFPPELKEIKKLFTKIARDKLKGTKWQDFDFRFNFMEIKMYLAEDIFLDDDGELLIEEGENLTKAEYINSNVGMHNDLEFDDQGKQLPGDTARGDHLIGTFTVGSPRNLEFQWYRKDKNPEIKKKGKWESVNGQKIKFSLGDGSFFFLFNDDEIPQLMNDGYLYKTKHAGKFSGKAKKGVSFGLVFRSVSESSYFDVHTDRWIPDFDRKYKRYVRKLLTGNKQEQLHEFEEKQNIIQNRKEVEGIKKNVMAVLDGIKF